MIENLRIKLNFFLKNVDIVESGSLRKVFPTLVLMSRTLTVSNVVKAFILSTISIKPGNNTKLWTSGSKKLVSRIFKISLYVLLILNSE